MTHYIDFPKRFMRLLGLLLLSLFLLGWTQQTLAQTARVQIIQNTADPALAVIDIFVDGTIFLDDFPFRTASPFMDMAAGVELSFAVGPINSAGRVENAFATFPITFVAGKTYTITAIGVQDTTQFVANPNGISTAFNLLVNEDAQEISQSDPSLLDVALVHGIPDAPALDVSVRDVGSLYDGVPYGTKSFYTGLAPGNRIIDIKMQVGATTSTASFEANISTLAGQSAVILASGFLDPVANQNGPALALLAVLPDGTVVSFPTAGTTGATAKAQIIHNAADPVLNIMDVYIEGTLALDDFQFQTATPFIDVPAQAGLEVAIAPANSTSIQDALTTVSLSLTPGETYTLVANGVLNPAQFAINPDSISTAFNVITRPETQTMAQSDVSLLDFMVIHGISDATNFDVWLPGFGRIIDNLAYGTASHYIGIEPAPYMIQIANPSDSTLTLATFDADLSALAGQSATLILSGFSRPAVNQNGPDASMFAVLVNGTTIPLAGTTVLATDGDGKGDKSPDSPDQAADFPQQFILNGNYPNPFNPTTTIQFGLDVPALVKVKVFDAMGREVMALPERTFGAGTAHTVSVEAGQLPSGLYVYQITAQTINQTYIEYGKMMLLK